MLHSITSSLFCAVDVMFHSLHVTLGTLLGIQLQAPGKKTRIRMASLRASTKQFGPDYSHQSSGRPFSHTTSWPYRVDHPNYERRANGHGFDWCYRPNTSININI